jgi:zinc D-Ala-D-Ala carboxypeptidase
MEILNRKNFKGEEFYFSSTAKRLGITNIPPEMYLQNGIILADKMQEVRDLLGKPIKINSGYRSPEVNKMVGSKPTSQHRLFQACDFVSDFGTPEEIVLFLKKEKVEVDQCLIEFGSWVHLSIKKEGNRNQFAYLDKKGFRLIC